MNTLLYKGHYIHLRWVGVKKIAYRVQIKGYKSIFKNVQSLKEGQLIISNYISLGRV